ncbi:MAG TPA: hypothetical protein VKA46_00290 [Gemmataceae bacterium]|nr:hypothetical protein [Gemmataceae bacterium]
MPSANRNRRQFLAGLTGLAALPLAAAAIGAAPPAPRARPDPLAHSDAEARKDRCRCPNCYRERVEREDNVLLAHALIALYALDAALGRLTREHCLDGVGGCDVCNDADGLRHVLCYTTSALEGQIIVPDAWESHDALRDEGRARAAAAAGGPAGLACVLALYDGLDALLDLTAGHCEDGDCYVCDDADGLVHHVRAGIDLIGGGLRLMPPMLRAVLERELRSAERKLARVAACEAEGGQQLPHSAWEQGGAEREAASCRQMLAGLRTLAALRG